MTDEYDPDELPRTDTLGLALLAQLDEHELEELRNQWGTILDVENFETVDEYAAEVNDKTSGLSADGSEATLAHLEALEAEIQTLKSSLDADGNDITGVNSFESESVSTDHIHTKSRPDDVIIWKDDGGEVYADGHDGIIAQGDDYQTIQSAIDWIEDTLGTGSIAFNPDFYYIDNGLTLPNGIGMRTPAIGFSQSVRGVIEGQSLDEPHIKIVENEGEPGAEFFNYLQNFSIRGPDGTEDAHGVEQGEDSGNRDFYMENVIVMNVSGHGAYIHGSKNYLKHCYFEMCHRDGLHLRGCSVDVDGGYIYGNQGNGINYTNTDWVGTDGNLREDSFNNTFRVRGVEFRVNHENSVRIGDNQYTVQQGSFIGCNFNRPWNDDDGQTGPNILCRQPVGEMTFIGNWFLDRDGNQTHCIEFEDDIRNCTIIGNHFREFSEADAVEYDDANNSVDDLEIVGNAGWSDT